MANARAVSSEVFPNGEFASLHLESGVGSINLQLLRRDCPSAGFDPGLVNKAHVEVEANEQVDRKHQNSLSGLPEPFLSYPVNQEQLEALKTNRERGQRLFQAQAVFLVPRSVTAQRKFERGLGSFGNVLSFVLFTHTQNPKRTLLISPQTP